MATVRCPRCGERVKVRDDERLRCRECGKSFRVEGEDEDEEEAPRRGVRRRAPARRSLAVPLLIGGGLLAALLVVVVIFAVRKGARDGAGDSPPADQSKVTLDNFKRVKPGMDLAEVEGILGGGKLSSEADMKDAFRRGLGGLEGEFAAGFGAEFAKAGEGVIWRRWDGRNLRVWVVFARTKSGTQLAAFSTSLEQAGGASRQHAGFMTLKDWNDLDRLAEDRKKEAAVRDDPKWVRGPQARALLPGDWRNDHADGLVFGPDGKLTEIDLFWVPDHFSAAKDKRVTYRVIDEARLEITHPPAFTPPPPPPGHPVPPFVFKPVTRTYEYLVSRDELALIEITPHAHNAARSLRTFYRVPPRPGGPGHAALIEPLLSDLASANPTKRQAAFHKLRRLGKGAAAALPALAELLRDPDAGTADEAAHVIGELREAGAPAVPALAEQLRDPNSKRCLAVVLALGRIGPAARDALPALRDCAAKSADVSVRNAALRAIDIVEGKIPWSP